MAFFVVVKNCTKWAVNNFVHKFSSSASNYVCSILYTLVFDMRLYVRKRYYNVTSILSKSKILELSSTPKVEHNLASFIMNPSEPQIKSTRIPQRNNFQITEKDLRSKVISFTPVTVILTHTHSRTT